MRKTKMNVKKVVAIAIAGMMLLSLSGCGSKPQTAKESASTPTTQAQTVKTIQEGSLTFAMTGLYKPLNYKKDGELVGFDVEIGNEVAKRIGLKPNPVTNPWETIIQGLKGNKYDAIIASMTATPERAQQIDFSDPYYISGAQIFVAEGNTTIKTKDDLKGKVIGVIQSSTWKDLAEKYTDKIKPYSSDVFALQDLPSGRIDAVITDKIVGISAIKEQGLKLKPIDSVLTEDKICIGINKGNPELMKKLNDAIKGMVADGTYAKISDKWFGYNVLK
ncbi:ABC transporter substrate-binding protein [Desulfosporosinus sp. Sb-LF]|uniref:ABC transporter substrate-binding protein n=1 Tax=Desulfosporosinus sp. Sb-LF TaxID=2560027 RepID=UPI00107FA398|nr:ABC transporter substrate-binding protein [Desulfosporosinus sp. Sb-LF]TGE32115.1 transporter substrate-binding domain-containing protein [Desulfosporosinus sp. Sb-LF]